MYKVKIARVTKHNAKRHESRPVWHMMLYSTVHEWQQSASNHSTRAQYTAVKWLNKQEYKHISSKKVAQFVCCDGELSFLHGPVTAYPWLGRERELQSSIQIACDLITSRSAVWHDGRACHLHTQPLDNPLGGCRYRATLISRWWLYYSGVPHPSDSRSLRTLMASHL